MKKVQKSIYTLVLLSVLFACKDKTSAQKEDEVVAVVSKSNPIVKDMFTADPAPFVYQDTFYVYTGHDEQAVDASGFLMNDWYVFSTVDMVNWTNHGAILKTTDFKWAKGQAWAAHVVEKNGKFYWYVTVDHGTISGMSLGVAVADSPTGPFVDAIGSALVTNDMTTQTDITWDDIDPAVFIDDDGTSYLYWGNTVLKYAKLKDNMIELDGDIKTIDLPSYTEAPWVFKREAIYYLVYSSLFPEVIDYATSFSPEGPWTYQGRLNELAANSPTNHQGIVEYKGDWYFVYHNGGLPTGGEFRRSVCIDYLQFNEDGTLKKIIQSSSGVKEIVQE